MKVVRSDRGYKYYREFDESGQCPYPFAKYLESWGICVQYTLSDTPYQNSIAERQNHTLIDMIRSMLSYSTLHLSLWIHVLKTTTYLLNSLSKAVHTTPYEI